MRNLGNDGRERSGSPGRSLLATWPLLAAAALGLLALPLGRCGGGGDGATPCTTAAECPTPGAICAGGRCAACSVDAQCLADFGAGATCDEGACHEAACPDGAVGHRALPFVHKSPAIRPPGH